MPFFDSLKSAVRAVSSTFSGGSAGKAGSPVTWNGAGYQYGNGISGLPRWTPGSRINWDTITGVLQDDPIAFRCLNIIAENSAQARIRIEKREAGEDKYTVDAAHPLNALLTRPNPFYSWSYLQRALLYSMFNDSDAYFGIERAGNGSPAQFWWLPRGVRPETPKPNGAFEQWMYRIGEKEFPVAKADIVHIPLGSDPNRPGFGLSAYRTLKQAQYILQQSRNYTANIMRNNGTMGMLLSPKILKDAQGNMTTVQADDGQMQAFTDAIKGQTQGDKAGGIVLLDFPFDVTFPKNSPQELALDKLPDRYENEMCAAFGVPIMMAGFYGGRESKTYANYEQAVQSFWEETELPLLAMLDGELSTQLLPQFRGYAANEYRVWHETSAIRALQPDKDALHVRYRSDFEANLITRADFKRGTGQKVFPEDEQVYAWMLPKVADSGQVSGGQVQAGLQNAGQDTSLLQNKQQAVTAGQEARVLQSPSPPPAPPFPQTSRARLLAPAGKAWEELLASEDYKASGSGHWITTDSGAHVLIGPDGTPQGNSPAAVALRQHAQEHGSAHGHNDAKQKFATAKPKGSPSEKSEPVAHSEEPATKATRSMLAQQSAVYVGKEVQRYSEEHNEPQLAKALGGIALKDNEPVDIELTGAKGHLEHGIEMKTKTVGVNDFITMKGSALARKAAWQETHNAHLHTVVYNDKHVYNAKGVGKHDESKREIYYRRGAASQKMSTMYKVQDHEELDRLLKMPTHELPKGAHPPKKYREPTR